MRALAGVLSGCMLLSCSVAQAQTALCPTDATADACVDELVFAYGRTLRAQAALPVLDATKAKEKAEASTAVAGEAAEEKDQAGTATAGGQASSTFTDLVPLLNMAGLLSDSDDTDGTIAVDLNFLLQFWNSDTTKHDSQLTWELDLSPTPFEPLVQAIPVGVRDTRSKELQEKIDEKADSRLLYTFSIVSNRFGRDFRRHEKQFSTLMQPVILEAGGQAAKDKYDRARGEFSQRLAALGLRNDITVSALSTDQRNDLYQLIADARANYSKLIAAHLDAMSTQLEKRRILSMADLVLQQPQFLISAEKTLRSRVSGPESQGIKLTYEHGFVNLNSFLSYASSKRQGACQKMSGAQMSLDESQACLQALDAYLDTNSEALQNANRVKVSAEYKQVEDWKYALPDDGVDINLPKHNRLVLALGMGRALPRSTAKDRIDFEIAYDSNLDNDDTNKERLVATLTYTRRFGDTDIPFSIVYANKSEFLKGSDKQIGVHFGVKFRTPDKN